ncbi:MAG: HAMP domain-containing sensor histidine kinase [Vulcanimicrobiota bacterium]
MARLPFGLLLATALLGSLEILFSPPTWPGPSSAGLWLMGAVLLQGASRSTPNFGSFQLQMAWALVCWKNDLLLPLLLWLGLTLLMLRPRPWEVTADALAACCVLPLGRLGPVVSGALVLATQTQLLRWMAREACGRRYSQWLRLELNLAPLRWSAWWICCAAFWVNGPYYLKLLWLPGLLGLHWGAQNAVFRVQAEQAQKALETLTRTQDELRRALWERDRDQHVSTQERGQLQLLQERLSYLQDLQQIGPLLGEWLGPWLQLRSAALYLEDLDCVWVSSPENNRLETVSLWLGARPLDRLPQVLQPPWLEVEPQAVLLPVEGCWLYLGRSQTSWQAEEFARLSRVVEVVRPWLRGLLSQRLQNQQLKDAQNLRVYLDSLSYLLHCAHRLLQPLELQPLWEELLSCLGLCFQVQAAGWLDEGQTLASWGIEPPAVVLAWSQGLSGTGYLAWGDRSRWPVPWAEADNVIALPVRPRQILLLAFSGQELVTPQQLQVVQGLGQLFLSSLARAQLFVQLEQSRELWLQSQKTLAVAQMSAGVAHELNSPLAAARLALEAALRAGGGGKINAALQACQRAQEIIEKLRQLSTQEAQLITSLDLVQVLRDLLAQLPGLQGIRTQGPPSLVVQASRSELERAVLPVLVNALETGASVTLSWAVEGSLATVTVQDGGPGVPAEVRGRLGEAFFTTKVIGTNMGLGLATVDQACRRLGGRWDLVSRPQVEGTRVTLWIPRSKSN